MHLIQDGKDDEILPYCLLPSHKNPISSSYPGKKPKNCQKNDFDGTRTEVKLVERQLDTSACYDTFSAANGPMDSNTVNQVNAFEGGVINFPVGSYVMAPWGNEYEYLAEVLSLRKRHGCNTEYKIRFVWDHVIQWYCQQKLREATKYEIDYVLQLCHKPNSITSRLLDNDIATTNKRTRHRQCSDLSEVSSSDISFDNNNTITEASIGTRKRKSSLMVKASKADAAANRISLANDEMVYDKSVAKFTEACKRRRQIKKQEVEEDSLCQPGQFKKSLNESSSSPHHSPYSRSSLDPCGSLSPKSTDTPDSVELNNVTGFSTKQEPNNNSHHHHLLNGSNGLTQPDEKILKNYPCPYCSRTLRHVAHLKTHILNYHPHEGGAVSVGSPPPPPPRPPLLEEDNSQLSLSLSKVDDLPEDAPTLASKSANATSTSAFVTGLIDCALCGQRCISHKIDVRLGHIRCGMCLTWTHRQCLLSADAQVAKFLRESTTRYLCQLCQKHGLHSVSLGLSVAQEDCLQILDSTLQLNPVFDSLRSMLHLARPAHSGAGVPPTPVTESSSGSSTAVVEQFLYAFEQLNRQQEEQVSCVTLQDLGPEILSNDELLPTTSAELVEEFFSAPHPPPEERPAAAVGVKNEEDNSRETVCYVAKSDDNNNHKIIPPQAEVEKHFARESTKPAKLETSSIGSDPASRFARYLGMLNRFLDEAHQNLTRLDQRLGQEQSSSTGEEKDLSPVPSPLARRCYSTQMAAEDLIWQCQLDQLEVDQLMDPLLNHQQHRFLPPRGTALKKSAQQ